MEPEIKKVATRLIQKVLIVPPDVAAGVGKIKQNRSSGEVEVPLFNPTFFMGNLVVDKYEDLINPNKINPEHLGQTKLAFVVDKGLFYKYNSETKDWVIATSAISTIKSIDDLTKDFKGYDYTIVTQANRGGIFIYDERLKDTNDGGTIINGWVRQYNGAADVKWFGAIGDGVTDDTAAIQKAASSCPSVLITQGTYKVSQTINLPSNVCIEGVGGSIVGVGDITFIKLGGSNTISNLQITGDYSKTSQVGVLIEGDEANLDSDNSHLDNVTFKGIGGCGVKVERIISGKNSIVNCKFLGCKVGVKCGILGAGLSVLNSYFFGSTIGAEIQGDFLSFTSCVFQTNETCVKFSSGNPYGEGVEFNNCKFSGRDSDITSEEYRVPKVVFNSCSFSRSIDLISTNKFKFVNCTLDNCTIKFDRSDENLFLHCNLIKSSILNDLNASKTLNYWHNCVDSEMKTPTTCKNGGYLEVINTQNWLTTRNISMEVLPFNKVVANSMPYHENFTKFNFFDSSTNHFDFTQVKNLGSQDLIYGNIQLFTSAGLEYLRVYIYEVDSGSETLPDAKIGLTGSKLVCQIPMSSNQPIVGIRSVFGTFTIPRGKYKIVIGNTQDASHTFYAHEGRIGTSAKAAYRVRFWGI